MQFAVDENGKRTHIGDALAGRQYFCPCCGGKTVQRRGQKNIAHFAHARGSECSDNWHYEEMSEWHREWQEKYPVECREVVLEKDGIKHRADVCINGTVIEFQHSPISAKEFNERNAFYTSTGNKLIWLFDETFGRKKDPENINIYIYVQTEKGIVDSEEIEKHTEDEFKNLSTSGRLGRPKLYHTLQLKMRENGDAEYYGCPINKNGYAPRIREYTRTACDECEYCLDQDQWSVKCMGRYKDLDIRLVVKQDGNNLTYIDFEGNTITTTVSEPKEPGESIISLAYKYKPNVMIVRNIKSGYEFRIWNPVSMIQKYNNHVYGQMRKTDMNFYTESNEIFYANSPDWVVVWYGD